MPSGRPTPSGALHMAYDSRICHRHPHVPRDRAGAAERSRHGLWRPPGATMVACPGGNRCGRIPRAGSPGARPRAIGRARHRRERAGARPGPVRPSRSAHRPWLSRAPSCRIRRRGYGCVQDPRRPLAGASIPADRRRPARAWDRRHRGRSRASGAETRRAHPGPAWRARAVPDPPSEDDRRRMPEDAAPRFRLRPGPAIPWRRRPRRGAEHAIP
jgi:hypothetical protein